MVRYNERCEARRIRLEEAAGAIAAFCAEKSDIVSVRAFGSFATGAVHPWSDLDLLVVRETNARPLRRADDIYLEAPSQVGFDVVVVTPRELRESLPLTPFGRTILSQARTLYERR
ncbi:MAG: nucleotidyltransferase domain-containing protein [Candidatus Baltobacteraceae bacterium]|jgi:predicted nucleotidyltransferase